MLRLETHEAAVLIRVHSIDAPKRDFDEFMLTTKLFLQHRIAILAHSGDYMRPNIKATESKIRIEYQ